MSMIVSKVENIDIPKFEPYLGEEFVAVETTRMKKCEQRAEAQAPMEERRALARDWLKRWTSASCSASTMTRASCSVPE
jgi:hypothetical protein